jgi:hypothetical protein
MSHAREGAEVREPGMAEPGSERDDNLPIGGTTLMATIFPDADIRNADWPKRTPDRHEDLGIEMPKDSPELEEAIERAKKKAEQNPEKRVEETAKE